MKYFITLFFVFSFNFLSAQDQKLKEEVRELINGLGSNDYTIRIESFKKLSALKIRAFPYLNQTLKEKNDFEVTEAIEKLLKNILNYKNTGFQGKSIPKKGKTWAEVNNQFCEWFAKQNIDAYIKVNANDTSLSKTKDFFNLINKKKINILPESENNKLIELANSLKNQTKDPLVLLHLTNNLEFLGLDKSVKSQFQQSSIEYQKYPTLIQFYIQLKVREFFSSEKTVEENEKLTKGVIDLFIDSIDSKTYDAPAERNLIILYNQLWLSLDRQQKEIFITAFNSKKVPLEWFVFYANGRYHLDLIEYYRQKAKSNDAAKNYENSNKEFVKSREAYLSAYGLNPNIPEICSVLIQLDGSSPAKAREWFDKLLLLQIDIEGSYGNFLNVLSNYDFGDSLSFGNELLLTGEFNSYPFNFYPELIARYYRIVQSYRPGNFIIDGKEEIYQNLIYVFENSMSMKNNQKLINLLIGFSYFHSDWQNLEKFYGQLKGKIDLSQLSLNGNEEEIEYSLKGYLELKDNKVFLTALKDYEHFKFKAAIPMLIGLYGNTNGYAKFFIFQLLLKTQFMHDDESNALLYKFYDDVGYKELANQKIFQIFELDVPEIKQFGEKLLDLLKPFEKQCYLLLDKKRDFKLAEKDEVFKNIEEIAVSVGNITGEDLLQMKIYASRFAYIDDSVIAAFKSEYHKLFSSLSKPGYMINIVRIRNEMNRNRMTVNRWYPFEALFWNKTKKADRSINDQNSFIKKALELDKKIFDKDFLSILDTHGSIIGRLRLAQEFFKSGQFYWAARLETESLKWHYTLNRAGSDGWSAYQSMAQLLLMTGYEKNAQYYADSYCKFDGGVDSGWYLAAYINFLNGNYDRAILCLEKGLGKKKDGGEFLLGEKRISGTKNLKDEIINVFLKSDKYNETTKKVLEEIKLK
jgi:hypothetical protein